MPKQLSIAEFLENARHWPVADVRSPGEFRQGHIPGAVNIPLFSDEERAVVGTLYKQQGREEAIEKGKFFAGKKISEYVEGAKRISAGKKLLVHCWRGGMRSAAMAELFEQNGIESCTLKNGYKIFRRHVLASFAENFQLRVVGGETGSGKTEILYALGKKGEQVLDLEALACHRGSSFGALGQSPQPTNEQFENELFHALQNFDHNKPLWIEDESQHIGKVFLPQQFWEQKISAPCFRMKIPFEIRVQRLLKDYGNFPVQLLEEAVVRIKKRLGGLATKLAVEALHNGDLAETVRIALRYYDKTYAYPHQSRNFHNVHFVDSDSGDPVKNAELILAKFSTADSQQ